MLTSRSRVFVALGVAFLSGCATGTSGFVTTDAGKDTRGAADTAKDDGIIADTNPIDSGRKDTSISEDTAPPEEDTEPPPDEDTGVIDTGRDTGVRDTGTLDTGTPDLGAPGPVGKKCATDGDCAADVCTKTLYSVGALYATPVCMGVDTFGDDACLVGDGTTIPLCEGGAGYCTQSGVDPSICEPLCKMSKDGSWLGKCAGSNSCDVKSLDASNTAYGTCSYLASCTTDLECPAGNKCDALQGVCLKTCTSDTGCTLSGSTNFKCDTVRGHCTFKFPKKPNDSCTTENDCLCFKGATDTAGYCVSMCRTGAATCAVGQVCDTLLSKTDTTTGAAIFSFSKAPDGLFGYCARKCTTATECPTGQICDESAGMSGQKTCRPKP